MLHPKTRATLFGVFFLLPVSAQTKLPPKNFPVAAFSKTSIKRYIPGATRVIPLEFLPDGKFRATIRLRYLLSHAFAVPVNPDAPGLTGVPAWTDSDKAVFDMEASGPMPPGLSGPARQERMRAMLRSLLADQFKMVFHRERKEVPVYVLKVAKGGLKLPSAKISDCPARAAMPFFMPASDPCHDFGGGRGRGLHAQAADMSDLVSFVENWTGRPLLDKTGLKGLYTFDTTGWLPMPPSPPPAPGTKAEDGTNAADLPTLFQFFNRLGLEMLPARARVDAYVIDHIELPAAN